jgi:aldehyde dehydrogenase (NAD+)
VNVKNEMTLAWEEIFGLVLSVIAYDSEEEAIAIANDSKAGRVVNNGMTDDPRLPGGGFKYSSVGREYRRCGIEAFLEPRTIPEA